MYPLPSRAACVKDWGGTRMGESFHRHPVGRGPRNALGEQNSPPEVTPNIGALPTDTSPIDTPSCINSMQIHPDFWTLSVSASEGGNSPSLFPGRGNRASSFGS